MSILLLLIESRDGSQVISREIITRSVTTYTTTYKAASAVYQGAKTTTTVTTTATEGLLFDTKA